MADNDKDDDDTLPVPETLPPLSDIVQFPAPVAPPPVVNSSHLLSDYLQAIEQIDGLLLGPLSTIKKRVIEAARICNRVLDDDTYAKLSINDIKAVYKAAFALIAGAVVGGQVDLPPIVEACPPYQPES